MRVTAVDWFAQLASRPYLTLVNSGTVFSCTCFIETFGVELTFSLHWLGSLGKLPVSRLSSRWASSGSLCLQESAWTAFVCTTPVSSFSQALSTCHFTLTFALLFHLPCPAAHSRAVRIDRFHLHLSTFASCVIWSILIDASWSPHASLFSLIFDVWLCLSAARASWLRTLHFQLHWRLCSSSLNSSDMPWVSAISGTCLYQLDSILVFYCALLLRPSIFVTWHPI